MNESSSLITKPQKAQTTEGEKLGTSKHALTKQNVNGTPAPENTSLPACLPVCLLACLSVFLSAV